MSLCRRCLLSILFSVFLTLPPPRSPTLFPYTTLFRSHGQARRAADLRHSPLSGKPAAVRREGAPARRPDRALQRSVDRKSTRLNSSHVAISYAVFCLKKKNRA